MTLNLEDFEPVAYGVLEGGDIESCGFGYIAAWSEACHEHINEAISEHNIEGAGDWKVVDFYTASQMQQVIDQCNTDQEMIKKQQSLIDAGFQLCEIKDKRLVAAQAKNERLREALNTGAEKLFSHCDNYGPEHLWEPDICHISTIAYSIKQALATTSPSDALREYDSKLVDEFIHKFKRHVGGDGEFWLHELEDFADKIRKGKF